MIGFTREPNGKKQRPSKAPPREWTKDEFVEWGNKRLVQLGQEPYAAACKADAYDFWEPLMDIEVYSTALYVIWAENWAIKIGTSRNPARRATGIQVSNDRNILVYWAVRMQAKTAKRLEKLIHLTLRHEAVHARGEWYYMHPVDAVKIINKILGKLEIDSFPDPQYGKWRPEFL